jgi:UDP-glucuronate 4-epimerase
MSEAERFLVTGALGCIGAWTVHALVSGGTQVVAFDLATDPRRLRDISTPEEFSRVTFEAGDITELGSIEDALDRHAITHVIHLAALQVPACRANPSLGALVNVVGTVNVFEAVRKRLDRITAPLVYTGSMGMFGLDDADPATGWLEPDARPHPSNHYGVYKQANEGTARVYWGEGGVSSIGIRPMTVYGPGRDFGMTSTPTKAIAAAIARRRYTITFGGSTLFQLAEDVGRTLVAAARSSLTGARVYNLSGNLVRIDDFIAAIEREVPEARGTIDAAAEPLPFPERISDRGIEDLGSVPVTPLQEGVARTVAFFREQRERGAFDPIKHGLEPEPASAGHG